MSLSLCLLGRDIFIGQLFDTTQTSVPHPRLREGNEKQ